MNQPAAISLLINEMKKSKDCRYLLEQLDDFAIPPFKNPNDPIEPWLAK